MELVLEGRDRRRWPAPSPATAVAAWVFLIAGCAIWGASLLGSKVLFINAPPLYGSIEPHAGAGAVAAVAAAAAIVWKGPALAARLRWSHLLAASGLAAAAWGVGLSLTAGADTFAAPLGSPHEYLAVLPLIESPGEFLSTFGERVETYPTHVRGHPPGMALIVYGLAQAGLGGSVPAAALILVVGATAPAAVLIAARAVADEQTARAAAPFLILAPAAVWIVTSADALFMGVGAWAVTLMVLAVLEARRRRAVALAIAGGLLFGITCFLSFGLVLLAAIPASVAIWRRQVPRLLPAAVAAVAVAVAVAPTGYWWLDGLVTARGEYYDGVAAIRPFGYFVIADLAAFAIATGPAAIAGLTRLGRGPLLALVGGALVAVAAADLSAMSKGEVERIWLPFAPWVLLATAALPVEHASRRRWLGIQAAVALTVQGLLVTAW